MKYILKIFSSSKICLNHISGHTHRPYLFQAKTVDRAVDRAFWAVSVHTVHVCWTTGLVDRQPLQSTDCMALTLCLCWSTGPVDRQFKILFLNLPCGRPEPTAICQVACRSTGSCPDWHQRLYFGSVLFFMSSNGYFLFLSGETHP